MKLSFYVICLVNAAFIGRCNSKPQTDFDKQFSNLVGGSIGSTTNEFDFDLVLQLIDENQASDPQNNKDIDRTFAEFLDNAGALPTSQPITTTSQSNCICVPRQNCNDNGPFPGRITIGGLGDVVDLRTQGNICSDSLDVCCNNPSNEVGKSNLPSSIPTPSSCGQRNPLGVGVHVAFFPDRQSQVAEFPWTVIVLDSIAINNNPNDSLACGGSLIHPQVVLTVAHCIERRVSQPMKVRVGEWDIDSVSEEFSHEDIAVSRAILHPQYHLSHLQYNMALLFLSKPAVIKQNINTICLPSDSDTVDEIKCLSSGWGKNVFGKRGVYQKIMKKITIPIVNNLSCEKALRKTNQLGAHFKLHDSSICAGGNGQDTCTGDGGSPLVCKKVDGSEKYVQMGVVAWGIGCNQAGLPGVYSSVKAGMPWIRSQVTSQFGQDAASFFT